MHRLIAAAALPLTLAGVAAAQTTVPAAPAAVTTSPTPAAAAPGALTAAKDPAVEDRIMALVRAGRCGPARTAALKAGDPALADQIASMCGARSSDPFAGRGRGGRKGGGGR